MTLARTALRLCAAGALKGAVNDRPTIAQGRVYDSRNDPFQPEDFADDAKPIVVIVTDGDDGDALSSQNGGPPFHRNIELVLELAMVARAPVTDDDGNPTGGYVIGVPDTDARLEASLDLLEFQVIRRLSADPAPLPALFRKLARIWKRECHRQIDDTAGVKIASRVLVLTCEVSDDRISIFNNPGDPLPTGLDALPEPLRTVAQALPAGSAGADTCAALAAAITQLTLPPLEGVDAIYDGANRAPPASEADDRTVVGQIDLDQ